VAENDEEQIVIPVSVPGTKEAAEEILSVVAALEKQRDAIKAIDEATSQSQTGARLAEFQAQAEKLNVTQQQTAAVMAQVTAASNQTTASLAEQEQAIKDAAAQFEGLHEAFEDAFRDTEPIQKLKDEIAGLADAGDIQALANNIGQAVVAGLHTAMDLAGGAGNEMAADIAAGIGDGIEEGVKAVLEEHGIIDPAQVAAAIDTVQKQFEAAKLQLNIESNAGEIDKQTSDAFATIKQKASALEADKLAAVRSGLGSQRAETEKQTSDELASLQKKYADFEAGKTELVKASLALQSSEETQALSDQYALVKQKVDDLERYRADAFKSGLDEQQTDLEKALNAEVDALKKKFDGINISKLIGGVGGDQTAGLASLSAELDKLSNKLAAVKAMDSASAQSGYLSRLAEYRAEAARLNSEQDRTAASVKGLSSAFDDNAKSIADNTVKLRSQVGAGASAISQLGHAFAQVVPEVAGFQNALDIGMRSLGGMLGVLGGGPGIVLGGVVAAVGLLGSAMTSAKKEADELAKSTEANRKALGDYLSQITNLRQQVGQKQAANIGEAAKEQSLTKGTASAQDYAIEVEALQKLQTQRDTVNKELAAAYAEGNHDEVVRLASIRDAINKSTARIAELSKLGTAVRGEDLGQKQAEAKNKQDKLDFEGDLAEAGGMPEDKKKAAKPDDEASKTLARLDANRAAIEKLRDMQADYRDKQIEADKAAAKLEADNEIQTAKDKIEQIQRQYQQLEFNKKALVSTSLDEQKQAMDAALGEAIDSVAAKDAQQIAQLEEMRRAAWQESHDLFMQLEDEKAQQVSLNIQKEKSERSQVTQSLMALGTTAAQLTAKQLSEAVKGHKIQAAMILEGIGDAMVAEGVRVMFQGGAQLLMGNYASGGGLIALGAAEMGVGLGLGAAGAAAQPPPTATGNGASTTPASPIRDNQQSSNENQRGPTVIYIDMPTVVSPSAEDGMRVRQAIDAASRVYGAPV
jgi:hypothetical protein